MKHEDSGFGKVTLACVSQNVYIKQGISAGQFTYAIHECINTCSYILVNPVKPLRWSYLRK